MLLSNDIGACNVLWRAQRGGGGGRKCIISSAISSKRESLVSPIDGDKSKIRWNILSDVAPD